MNTPYTIRKNKPSFLVSVRPVYKNGKTHAVAKRRITIASIAAKASNGINSAESPRIKKILNTFDPRILPIVMSEFPFREAVIVTISSGREVPTAMTDNAIKNEGIPSTIAMEIVDSMSNQAPMMTPMIPKIMKSKFFWILSILSVSNFCFCFFALRIKTYSEPINN
ncbi:MAG: hypothetical protein MUO73_02695 [Thermoplasmata archaeon]|nr:hypothetical protein [Thermoplasmata archaeon]